MFIWYGSRPDALVLNSMLSIMNDKLNIPLKVCFDKIIFMYNELCFTLLIFFFIGIYYVVDARSANLPHIQLHILEQDIIKQSTSNKRVIQPRHSSLMNVIERMFGILKLGFLFYRTNLLFQIKLKLKQLLLVLYTSTFTVTMVKMKFKLQRRDCLRTQMRKMAHIMFHQHLFFKIYLEMNLDKKKKEHSKMKLHNLGGKRDKLLW